MTRGDKKIEGATHYCGALFRPSGSNGPTFLGNFRESREERISQISDLDTKTDLLLVKVLLLR